MRNYKSSAWACTLGVLPIWSLVVFGLDALPISDAIKSMIFLPFASAWIFLCVFLFRKSREEKKQKEAAQRNEENALLSSEPVTQSTEAEVQSTVSERYLKWKVPKGEIRCFA